MEEGLLLGQTEQWSVSTANRLVVHDSMTVRECTTLDILTAQTDVGALHQQRAKGKTLSSTPINALAGLDGVHALFKHLPNTRMKSEVGWNRGDSSADLSKNVGVNARSNRRTGHIWSNHGLPVGALAQPVNWLGDTVLLNRFVGRLELAVDFGADIGDLLGSDDTLSNQLVSVQTPCALLLFNDLVHVRLSEGWFIDLVVTMLSITDDINNNISLPHLTPFSGQLAHSDNSLWIISVDVKHGSVESAGNISAVSSRARIMWVSGETNLIVDNNMNSATSCVMFELAECHALINDALSSESCITMQQNTGAKNTTQA